MIPDTEDLLLAAIYFAIIVGTIAAASSFGS